LPVSRKLAKTPEVRALVTALAAEPFLHATYWLSTAYALCVGDAYRKSLAMFFTPPSLTSRLLDDLTASGVRFDKGSFCDPDCGGAAFLAPIALRMKEELRAKGMPARRVLEHISKNLFGADIDATLCELSKHFLLMALRGSPRMLRARRWSAVAATRLRRVRPARGHRSQVGVHAGHPRARASKVSRPMAAPRAMACACASGVSPPASAASSGWRHWRWQGQSWSPRRAQ
jgi:hypothetical protein